MCRSHRPDCPGAPPFGDFRRAPGLATQSRRPRRAVLTGDVPVGHATIAVSTTPAPGRLAAGTPAAPGDAPAPTAHRHRRLSTPREWPPPFPPSVPDTAPPSLPARRPAPATGA